MSDPFTIDRFLPLVGEVFDVQVEEAPAVPILLTEIATLATDADPRRRRQPFSLVFHAAPERPLEQAIYRLEREGMEPFECFLVPIGPDPNGLRYEAIYT